MKGKRGRPNIPLSNISNRKQSGLTGASSSAPDDDSSVQLATGGAAKKRLDKKARGGKKWMQDLHIKKGAMTAAAKREGVSNAEYEQEHKSDSGKAGKRARLALAFKKADHGKK